jgi:hypothetical protein
MTEDESIRIVLARIDERLILLQVQTDRLVTRHEHDALRDRVTKVETTFGYFYRAIITTVVSAVLGAAVYLRGASGSN